MINTQRWQFYEIVLMSWKEATELGNIWFISFCEVFFFFFFFAYLCSYWCFSQSVQSLSRICLDCEPPALQDRPGSSQSCLWEEGGTFICRSPKTWETEPSSEDRTPHTSAEWPEPTTSSACSGSHAALLDGIERKTVLHRRWKSGISPTHACLPSRLPSLLMEPLLSLLHFYPRAWSQSTLGNWLGGTT